MTHFLRACKVSEWAEKGFKWGRKGLRKNCRASCEAGMAHKEAPKEAPRKLGVIKKEPEGFGVGRPDIWMNRERASPEPEPKWNWIFSK